MNMLKGIAHYERTHQLWTAFHDDQARAVITVYEERARKVRTVINDKVAYYTASVARAAKEGKLAPLLLLRGAATLPDGSARANAAQVVGVEDRVWRLGGASHLLAGAEADEAVINARLAQQPDPLAY